MTTDYQFSMIPSPELDNALEDSRSKTLPLPNIGGLYQGLREGETKSAGLNRDWGFQSGYVVAEEDDHVGLGAVTIVSVGREPIFAQKLTSRHDSVCADRLRPVNDATVRS